MVERPLAAVELPTQTEHREASGALGVAVRALRMRETGLVLIILALFIAMSFIGGHDLKEVMARQGPMSRAAAADIASLGATLHFAATGRSPYGSGEPAAVLLGGTPGLLTPASVAAQPASHGRCSARTFGHTRCSRSSCWPDRSPFISRPSTPRCCSSC